MVIGSEARGLTEETIAACSGTVPHPMTDRVESLNAGIAGILLCGISGRRACDRARLQPDQSFPPEPADPLLCWLWL